MPVKLGNPAFSPVKDYAELQGDMTQVVSTVFINEGRIIKIDAGYAFCMIAEKISDLKQSESFKSGTPVCFVAHKEQYERWTFENPKLITQPTPLELIAIEWIEKDGSEWLNKTFKGKFNLNGAESVLNAIKTGKVWHILFEFEECESNLIKDGELKEKGKYKGGGGGSGKGQSELERLNDYQSFTIATAGASGEGCKTLIDLSFGLSTLKQQSPETFAIFMELLRIGNSISDK